MGVIDFYTGKNVLLTGTTGFIGKVLLEKFVRSIPQVGRIYVLIRNKKGLNTLERFKKEVLGSKCFDRARELNPSFDAFVAQKIRLVEGDLLQENVGLSPDDLKELTENLHVIMNCAASVDFNATLDEAIRINVYGTLRMFDLAQRTKNLENFLHVSTAYVNSDKEGIIEEKIYDQDRDAEELIAELYNTPKEQLVRDEKRILGSFPNTYTFTKSQAERILLKKRGNMSLTILRPSIVGCAWRDPYIGWLDSINASSAVWFLGGLGIMRFIEADPNIISDQVPVDYVVDAMVVSAATYANQHKMTVVHSAISARNPVKAVFAFDNVMGYWRAHPPEKRVASANMVYIKNAKIASVYRQMQIIPTKLYSKFAHRFGNAAMKRNADKIYKVIMKTHSVSELFKHFVKHEWIFITDCVDEMTRFCTPEELVEFQLDIAQVDWAKYYQYFAWGIHHFILGEKVEHPTSHSEHMDLLASLNHKNYFNDIKWAFNNGYNFKPRSKPELKQMILTSAKVKSVVDNLVKNQKKVGEEKFRLQLEYEAMQICDKIMSTYSMPYIKVSAWMLNIIFRSMYEKIVVDETSLARLAAIDFKTKGPIVFLPSHRSFVDFMLISYIFFAYKIKCPHVGAQEELLEMAFLPYLLKASGGFFMLKDKIEHVELYNAVMYEYIQTLMLDECHLQINLEGSRSRYGKALSPNNNLLSIVTDIYFDKKVPDVQLVPVTFNYDRVVEADTFPFELLGEEKLQPSLGKLVMSYRKLAKNFGKVFVKFGEPISLKDYTARSEQALPVTPGAFPQENQDLMNPFEQKEHRSLLVNKLGLDVLRTMNDYQVIMPTSIVASILLLRRKGISEEELTRKVTWLIQEIKLRGGKPSTDFANIVVKGALVHLDELLQRKKDIFHPSFSAKSDYKNIILLSYYRNMLGHLFFHEALIACSLTAYGYELAWKDGVAIDRLWESTTLLQKLIGNEYFVCVKLTQESFDNLLKLMVARGIFTEKDGKIAVAQKGEELMSYLCSMLWPFVEGYWITSVFLFTLKNRDHNIPLEDFELEVQGFAEAMYEERTLQFYEACSIDTIRNAINVFTSWGVIKIGTRYIEEKKKEVKVLNIGAGEAQLKELADSIQKYKKASLANTIDLPVNVEKKAAFIDFPFMSKL